MQCSWLKWLFCSVIIMRRLCLFIITVLILVSAHAQTLMNLDSLLKELPKAKQDSNKVFLLINIGQQYEDKNPRVAGNYYHMAGDLSKQIGYKLGIIKYIANYTYILNNQGILDSALILNLESVRLSREINDSVYLGKTLFNTGNTYRIKEDFENSVKYYMEGKMLFAKLGDIRIDSRGDDILQTLYLDMHQYEKGIEYGERAVAAARKQNDSILLSQALTNLGLNYSSLKFDDKALSLHQEALVIGQRIGNTRTILANYLNIGDYYLQTGRYDLMISYFFNGLRLAKEMELSEDQVNAYKGISFYYQSVKDYHRSGLYADSALTLAKEYGLRHQQAALYTHLSNLSYSKQDMRLGEKYARMSRLIEDSLLSETIRKTTQELEVKYETNQKQTRIHALESEQKIQKLSIERKNIVNAVLVAVIISCLLIGFLLYRNYKHRQRLQQQRINELETEKQLAATEAVLKGEELERTRLAKDLHDGLGGMLSGIKYSLNTMKGNLIMTPDNAQAFERSIDMLDSSIQEMRRVAHNMMPEALVKFGLDTALSDFCSNINLSGALKISYQSIGLKEATIEQTTAITIYRIVQELINNTMKHAAAKHAIVQVTKTDGHLSVTVEDDGKGFDASILQASKGIGWSSIQNRVAFLQGKVDVDSTPNKGTSVFIEINV